MDILTEKTLTILRDENVRKAVDEILDRRATEPQTVKLTDSGNTRPSGERPITHVRLRRIA
jgi:hypothetical protein